MEMSVTAPLLKWPGGKGRELERILPAMPTTFERYFEPFVGGGAVFWSVPPETPAFVNDTSPDLVALYRHVRARDQELFAHLDPLGAWWVRLQEATAVHAAALVEAFGRHRGLAPAGVRAALADLVADLLPVLAATVPPVWSSLGDDFADNVRTLVPRKIARMRKVERDRGQQLPDGDVWDNVEGAFKACAYTSVRTAYNHHRLRRPPTPRQAALFFFLREFAYAAMFRFNAAGEFNVPYGGISYNRKDFGGKVDHLRSGAVTSRLATTTIGQQDFEDFLAQHPPGADDFMFLDPPYDSDFSTYDQSTFGRSDHERLASVMADVDCRWQLVIKATPAVLDTYAHDDWHVLAFDKRYPWTIKERNDRDATHLLVTNYPQGSGTELPARGGTG